MKNATDFRQAVHESRESDRVVKFLTGEQFTPSIQRMMENGQIYGVYYNETGELVAEDIWQEVHAHILNYYY